MGVLHAPKHEKYPEYTLAELTGIRNENILNEKVRDLREAVFELERVEYGDSIYGAYLGSAQGEALFKTKIAERQQDIEALRASLEKRMRRRLKGEDASLVQMPAELDIDDLDLEAEQHVRELTLSVRNDINLKVKERVELALRGIGINYWPARDADGNDSYVIDYPRDLEIMRKVFTEEYFTNYRESLVKRLRESKESTHRQELEERVRKITFAMEKPGGHLAEQGYRTDVNPMRALYAFGALPMQKAHKQDLKRDLSLDNDIRRSQKDRVPEDDEEEIKGLDEVLFSNMRKFASGEYSVVEVGDEEVADFNDDEAEGAVVERRGSSVANLPYYKRYVWMPREEFKQYALEHAIQYDGSETTAKMLVDTSDKRVVTKEEREVTFIAAKDWASGDPEALKALKQVLLTSRNFILWKIKELKDRRLKYLINVDDDVLFQMGNIAILRAVQKYDPEMSDSRHHLSYLAASIEGQMRHLYNKGLRVDNSSNQISEPAYLRQLRKQVDDIKADLWSQNPARKTEDVEVVRELINRGILSDFLGTNFDNQTREEVYRDYGYALGRYQDYLESILYGFEQVPFEEMRGDDTIQLHSPDKSGYDAHAPGADEAYDMKQLEYLTGMMLLTLTSREQRVIMMRFGIGQFGPRHGRRVWEREQGHTDKSGKYISGLVSDMGATLEEVGDTLGVGKERIRQVEARALRKMKHPARSKAIRWLLPEDSYYHPLQEAQRANVELRRGREW